MFCKNARIVFQGDSITDYGRDRNVNESSPANQGLGSSHAMMIAARLIAEYPEQNLQFFNRGFCGDTVLNLYARWKTDVINLKPDYLSILIGANDTWGRYSRNGGVPVDRFEQVYRDLLDWTRQENPNVQLILCQPFLTFFEGSAAQREWLEDMTPRQEAVRRIANDYNAVFIPFQKTFDDAALKAPPEVWSFDGVHPLHAGYALMTNTWIQCTKDLL